eukprot:365270-Chlamydomonas_euryale.AAC.15
MVRGRQARDELSSTCSDVSVQPACWPRMTPSGCKRVEAQHASLAPRASGGGTCELGQGVRVGARHASGGAHASRGAACELGQGVQVGT